jgi:integrase
MANKFTKSFRVIKERNCTASFVLDTRSNKRGMTEYPLALRFTIDRKSFYHLVGRCYSEKKFSEICNATRSASDNFRIQKEWLEHIVPKYKNLLQVLNEGMNLTYELVYQAIECGNIKVTSAEKPHSFISIWEDTIHDLRTKDNGARFTTSESYVYALKSFKKILGEHAINGFNITVAEIRKWKEGMHNGVKDKNGNIIGKISDTTAGIYLRSCRAVWNTCIRMGYLKDVPYPFSNKKGKDLVSIPRGKTRRQCYLTVKQMTELYNLFVSKSYPEHWTATYKEHAHYSLGLFLVQYLCNGFNLADAARLTYNDYYYQNEGKAFLFNRKKTAARSADDSEVIIPIIPPLQVILDEIAAVPERHGFVFPKILHGAESEADRRKCTSQENSNIQDRIIRICHEALHWDVSICPSGTWCRHSFATNLRNAGVEMEYISASMGHAVTDHAITQIYIEHYPLEIQMEYNSKLLNLTPGATEREALMAKIANMSNEELAKLLA